MLGTIKLISFLIYTVIIDIGNTAYGFQDKLTIWYICLELSEVSAEIRYGYFNLGIDLYALTTECLCQIFHHWWHHKLSLWQPPAPPVAKELASWLLLDFNIHHWKLLTLKWLGHFFSKCDFIFWCCLPYVQYFLYETGPIQWMFSQHCGYWWPGALAPGHQ